MSEHTKLSFLQHSNEKVPVMVRFSLAVSTKGTPDTARNVRGFLQNSIQKKVFSIIM